MHECNNWYIYDNDDNDRNSTSNNNNNESSNGNDNSNNNYKISDSDSWLEALHYAPALATHRYHISSAMKSRNFDPKRFTNWMLCPVGNL